MSNEELLKLAERNLTGYENRALSDEGAIAVAQAASLLVIARNSVPQERTEIEVQPLELNSVRHLKDKPSPHNNS